MTKINKALDLNKLFSEQKKGKLLKKHITFPIYTPIKFDGNYVVVEVYKHKATFYTSGGLTYTHLDNAGDFFNQLPDAYYLAERIYKEGLLGDRNKCNLKGSKTAQTSEGHNYRVFDVIDREDYHRGKSNVTYIQRQRRLNSLLYSVDKFNQYAGMGKKIYNQQELDDYLKEVVKLGYEGIMCVNPNWKWEHHNTRRVTNFCKYKKRPSVDLLCIGTTAGTGKYEGLIGSLKLKDKCGRIVDVGSGMSDEDRLRNPEYFKGKVIEMFYEQIVDTYIQPTFGNEYEGVLIREDKDETQID